MSIWLITTSDLVRVVTSAAVTTDVHADWVDYDGAGASTPGRTNTLLTTATTTTVVASPGASTYRVLKNLYIRNRHASSTQDVTVVHSDGTNIPELIKATLLAGDCLHYDEHAGWTVKDNYGRLKTRYSSLLPTTSAAMSTVVLSADVTNNNASANTIADVTALSFSITSGNTYWFRFMIPYTAAATTTGSRWSINGPAITTLLYKSEYSLTTTSRTINEGLSTYDVPAGAAATSGATGSNVAWIEGIINCSANGTLIARFASEVSSSAIVAKAGAVLHYQQVI